MAKKWLLILGSFCLALALAGPNLAGAEKKAPKSIKVSSVLSFGGMFAGLGKQCQRSYTIWLEDVNGKGGIYVKEYGKKIPVEIKFYDDESNGVRTQFQLDVANEWGAVANLGGIGCSSFEMGTPMAQKNKMVWIGPGCGGWMPHQLGNKWMFNTLTKTKILDIVFYMLMEQPKETRPKKVAIFEINQLDCIEAALFWRQTAKTLGFEVVYDKKYAAGTKDFTALITGAKGAGAEILLAYPTPVGGPAIVKQMKMLDFGPKVIYFVRAPMAGNFGPDLGPLADYVSSSCDWHYKMNTPGNQRFVKRHKEKYGMNPPSLTGPGYVAAQVLEDAIKRAGSLDRKAIRDAMQKTDLETISGRVRYAPEGYRHECMSTVFQYMGGDHDMVYVREWSRHYVKNGMIKLAKFKYAPPWSER